MCRQLMCKRACNDCCADNGQMTDVQTDVQTTDVQTTDVQSENLKEDGGADVRWEVM